MPSKLPDELRRRAVQVKLPPALIARMEERCGRSGMSKTEFVERALEAALGSSAGRGGVRAAVPSTGASVAATRAVDPGVARADAFRARPVARPGLSRGDGERPIRGR